MAAVRAVAELSAVAAAVVLARLIPPAEFGHMAVTLIVGELALTLSGEGVGTPLVQRERVTRRHLQAATTLAAATGLALFAVTALAVPGLVAPVLGERSADLFRLYSPAFLLAALSIVPLARLQRDLRFRRIGLVEVTGVLVGSVTAVTLAVAGLDAEALVLGALAQLATTAIGLAAATGLALPRAHRRELRELAAFGLPAAAAGATGVGYRNADYLILGWRLTPLATGLYFRAYTLGVEYERKVSGILARVAFPVYSRAGGLEHLAAMRSRMARMNAVVILPLLSTFAVLAPVFVPWAFGAQWQPAVVPAQILALAGCCATAKLGFAPLVLAAGRPRRLLAFHGSELVLYAATVALAAPLGLTAVCAVVAAFNVVSLAVAARVLLQGATGIPARTVLADLRPALVGTAGLLAAAVPVFELARGLPALACLTLVAGAGAAAYTATLRRFEPSAFGDVRLVAGKVVPGRLRRATARSTASSSAASAVRSS
jgi:PST family polysaccharide transporter